jgi:methionyl-tRNA formyltransferase
VATRTTSRTTLGRAARRFARRRTPSPDERARVVFLGSGTFAVPILELLAGRPEIELVAVVSAPDRRAGRGGGLRSAPVAEAARRLGLALLQPSRLRSDDAQAAISALQPSLGVLADYGQLVPAGLLELPERGMLNLHPSLLPRHRGATPIPAAILAGDDETGVSLFQMDAGLDTGPLVAVVREALDGTEDGPSLERRLAGRAAALLDDCLDPWLRGELAARPQPDAGASLSRPLRRSEGRLDPGQPAGQLERQVRAYLGWPGSFLETPIGRLVVLRATIGPNRPEPAGSIVPTALGIALVTTPGSLALEQVQPAGGRPMTGAALVRGHPGILGQGPS